MLRPSERAPGLLVGDGVTIAEDAMIGGNAVIHKGTSIGTGCVVGDCAVIGRQPLLGSLSSAPRDPAPPAIVEEGAAVLAGAMVLAGARVARGSIVADQAELRERAVLGEESVLGRGSQIDNDVVVGKRVRIMTNCYLTAGCVIEDEVFIGPGVVTTNDNAMGRPDEGDRLEGIAFRRGCQVGGGVVICPGVEIGEQAYVAAGAVVTRNVAPGSRVMGVPAQEG
jgi:acetyltransferase-like isoleucine patch superfamily enzyme